mgnify:CR=1 FL=1
MRSGRGRPSNRSTRCPRPSRPGGGFHVRVDARRPTHGGTHPWSSARRDPPSERDRKKRGLLDTPSPVDVLITRDKKSARSRAFRKINALHPLGPAAARAFRPSAMPGSSTPRGRKERGEWVVDDLSTSSGAAVQTGDRSGFGVFGAQSVSGSERHGASVNVPPIVAMHAIAFPYHGGVAGVPFSTASVASRVGT